MVTPEHFQTVVVGSGFGGSVTAYRHAMADRTTLVLERGKPYPPGSFARSPWEMHNNLWDPDSGHFGLFEILHFGHIDGLVSAGLGGGSLIYANVLIRKDERWFIRRGDDGKAIEDWPITRAQLDPHYDEVAKILAPQKFPFDVEPYSNTPKTRAMKEAAEGLDLDWFLPDLAVSFADPGHPPIQGEPIHDNNGSTTNNLHGRTRLTCRLCGECDIGCNYGSKNTLDYNYLTLAQQAGAQLRTGCEAQTITPNDRGGYTVRYLQHDLNAEPGGADAAPQLVEVTCDRLVLSAGTFGTAYLLLRNRPNLPNLSPTLGSFFSGNGDSLGLLRNAGQTVDGRKVPRVLAPSRGSVITSTIRVADSTDGGSGPGYYIQDGGYPDLVDWLVEVTNIPADARRALRFVENEVEAHLHRQGNTSLDQDLETLIGDGHSSASNLPLLGMGMDTPGGQFTLAGDTLELSWNRNGSREYFERVKQTMEDLADQVGAKFEEDPLSIFHGKLITVHPVGGCAMGTNQTNGVVDTRGEVFGHEGLSIADGSVMPGPVGPNPSFTIAALANHFSDSQI